jgi:murein tripeptide amidase MpaA
MRSIPVIFFLLAILTCPAQDTTWQTYYEQSGKKQTPRYGQTIEFCRRLDRASPMVTFTSFGKSAQGRDLPLLIIDRQGLSDPASIRKSGRLILLIQACIHPGECEGKDAGLMLVRDMMIFKKYPGLLDHVSVLFIPIFNTDGHEQFGPFNRINQNGPEEMGWRVTATNLNLNRDYLKADAPEMQAWLHMFHAWMPDFFIDTHTTDGADYQYVLTYMMELGGDMDPGLIDWSRNSFLKPLLSHLEDAGISVTRYVELKDWNNLKSGLVSAVSPPMLSQAYTSILNRPGFLIETHMLKPYDLRVQATYECLKTGLEILNRESATLQTLVKQADQSSSGRDFRAADFTLRYRIDFQDSTLVDFKGIGFEILKSDITGQNYYRYTGQKKEMQLAFFGTNRPWFVTRLPEAYIVPVEWQDIIYRLELHGIRMYRLEKDTTLEISTWKFSNPKWQLNPYEGRHQLTGFDMTAITVRKTFRKGSVIVDLAQPSVRLIAQLLEPRGNGSLLNWGFFDAIFEQKEYAEQYVMEPLAKKMLEKDPALKSEFEKKKQEDSSFASNPYLILRWFYSKSPYWDQGKDVYPVGELFDRSAVNGLIKGR